MVVAIGIRARCCHDGAARPLIREDRAVQATPAPLAAERLITCRV
jgi:hypothetical protein